MKGIALKAGGYLIGLAAIAFIIIYALPNVAFGDYRPFDTPLVRWLLMAAVSIAAISYLVFDVYRRTKAEKELAAGMSSGGDAAEAGSNDDSQVLQEKMNDAITTLKKATGAKGDFLYDLPWYIIIGPPGAGKTTALINSGLKFPLAKGSSPQAIAGVGGTRYCDWWFTEEAVMIDTAGRYTTQDSDAKGDKKSWLSFLQMLKRSRPKQPINGVLVCISVEDVLSLPQEEVYAHADAIRTRLIELHQHLKVDFPVYGVFTKSDLIAGFMEFFSHLNEEGRRAVWGATFQTDDKTANMIGEVPGEFDLLIQRLNQEMVDRLQEDPNPTARVQMFGFPSQVAALKKPVHDFLTRIFEPTRYHSNATLRGFYFTSGTQEGTPIDQLIGALARSFGTQETGAAQYSGLGKSYFLTDLLQQVVFGESGWVSTNRSAVRRSAFLKTAAYIFLFLCSAAAIAGWWISYGKNSDLINRAYASITQYKTIAAPVRDETSISDRDFARVLPALHHLRNMPAGYGSRDEKVPLEATLGLSQWPRLNASAESAYEMALQRLYRPRLMYRMEERMRDNITNPGFLTEALKVYLMLGGTDPIDKERVLQWWRADWAENLFRGPQNAAGRQALEDHLVRLISLDPPEGFAAVDIDRQLVAQAQAAIGRMSVSDRAFEILRSASRSNSAKDWIARRKAGQDATLVFEGAGGLDLDAIKVPYFFTYAGFQEDFLAKIPSVAEQVQQERKLLGDVANQSALAAQYENLAPALIDRYQKEYISTWRAVLGQLRIKLLTADKPRYVALQAAAAPTSPIAQIIESVGVETQLTKEKPAGAAPAQGGAAPAPSTAPKMLAPGGELPGAAVEAAFRPFQQLTEGARGQRGVDELLRGLSDIYTSLAMLNDPTRSAEGQVKFRDSLRNLQATATRFPDPFKGMIQTAVGAFDNDATGTTIARLNQSLGEEVTRACQQAISGVYPFSKASDKDIPIQEFQRIFGPSGVIDRFYTTRLSQLVDTSKSTWTWNQANPVARQMSANIVRDFQRASEIRQAFFPGGQAGFTFVVKNLALGDGIENARLEINSGVLSIDKPKPPEAPSFSIFGSAPQPPPQPPAIPQVVTFQWPGPVGLQAAGLAFLPAIAGRPAPPPKSGPWGVFRLFDGANRVQRGDALEYRFSVSGREATYQVNVSSLPNPFVAVNSLPSFRCPAVQ
ncbi:type VI secretion system membrane subunit TssM [Terrarubrum flagellatum]|uniref:type VI secretion system membrane subunit TssM n=1 Tax=Terrirubrum flagellatum TaxID=2895980 RepID=UPI0031454802